MDPFYKIGGLDEEVEEIEQLVNMALNKNENFKNIPICKAALIYGNSGTGKSLLLNAMRKSTTANIFSLDASEMLTKTSDFALEELLSNIFEDAVKSAPSLILLDDVDILCPNRNQRLSDNEKKIISALIKAFDKLNDLDTCKVFVLGATNKIDSIDSSLRRCGRFDREIEIPTPNAKAR